MEGRQGTLTWFAYPIVKYILLAYENIRNSLWHNRCWDQKTVKDLYTVGQQESCNLVIFTKHVDYFKISNRGVDLQRMIQSTKS